MCVTRNQFARVSAFVPACKWLMISLRSRCISTMLSFMCASFAAARRKSLGEPEALLPIFRVRARNHYAFLGISPLPTRAITNKTTAPITALMTSGMKPVSPI